MKRLLFVLWKWAEYVLELIVIALGIFGALLLNNWNEDNKDRREERRVMISLQQELSENVKKFDKIYNLQSDRHEIVLKMIQNVYEDAPFDTIDANLNSVAYSWTYDPSLGIYNSIISSVKIDLISHTDLKNKVSAFRNLLKDYQEEEIYVFNNLENMLSLYY
jgi:hypothetical protein